MAWVIPIMLAYVPGVVIGFLCATLVLTRYHRRRRPRPTGRGGPGSGRRSR